VNSNEESPLMAALRQFEATEANLVKLEKIWQEITKLIPNGIQPGNDPAYEDRCRAFRDVLDAVPMIDGWKPACCFLDLNQIALSRFDAQDLGEFSEIIRVEEEIESPGNELREYRFRFNKKRRALIQDALSELIDQIDSDIRNINRLLIPDIKMDASMEGPYWEDLCNHVDQIATLLGSSVNRPQRWNDLRRHLHSGSFSDFHDIEQTDWPDVKVGLRESLYGSDHPVHVQAKDLSDLVATRPQGTVATKLHWERLTPDEFERLVFTLISAEPGYENPGWLMQPNAPDRGRDLSVFRVIVDPLTGTIRSRVIIQCKHWLSRSVNVPDISALIGQMSLWEPPRVDVHIIATTGRFTLDAVTYIEKHNQSNNALRIEMWPESHLELLLAARPALIAEFGLR
jgi:hypothetical protein